MSASEAGLGSVLGWEEVGWPCGWLGVLMRAGRCWLLDGVGMGAVMGVGRLGGEEEGKEKSVGMQAGLYMGE